jgi:hypothetical protein
VLLPIASALAAPGEVWDDGLLPRLPAEGVALETGAATFVEDGLWFGQAELGVGAKIEEIELGGTVYLGLQAGTAAQGEFFLPGPVGGDLWFLLRDGPTTHAFGAGASTPVRPLSFYWVHPAETSQRTSITYMAQTRTATDVQLTFQLRTGISLVLPLELAVGGSVVKTVRPWLAVSGALVVGYMPSGTTLGGIHLRPLRQRSPVGLELGVLGGMSIPLEERLGPSVQAMAAIKGWWVGTGDEAR